MMTEDEYKSQKVWKRNTWSLGKCSIFISVPNDDDDDEDDDPDYNSDEAAEEDDDDEDEEDDPLNLKDRISELERQRSLQDNQVK